MNELSNIINKLSIDINIDNLSNILEKSNIEYDEIFELKQSINNNIYNYNITYERYERYIRGITIWEINDISYNYIKEMILEYLNTYDNKSLAIQIDKELLNMINNIN